MTAVASALQRDATEARLRARLAACVRLLHMEGMVGYNGHVSALLPGRDAFLIHSLVESRAEVAPESLLLLDLDSRVIDGPADLKPPSERYIHSEIYRARADIGAVAHLHSEHAIAFTLAKSAVLRPMRCDAVRWRSGIPTHADPTRIRDRAQGAALATTPGGHGAALMRAHGAVVVAASVPAVLASAIQFEENARAQIMAAALGEIDPLSLSELEALAAASPPEFEEHYAAKIWTYYVGRGIDAGVIPAAWRQAIR